MFQFLTPIWLLAIGGILIPLIIHLWNVKKGKTLLIGSIRLFGESSRQNARSFRLMDLLRLILRCLILIALALLLAGPVFNQKKTAEGLKGWILMDENHLEEGYSTFKTEIDSLIKVGYETRYFNAGFKEFDLSDTAKKPARDNPKSIQEVSYWSLVKALDDTLPKNARAFIYSGNRQNRFAGSRPQITSSINWKTFQLADSVYNKIEAAYLTSSDSLKLVLGRYEPEATTFEVENTSFNNLNPAYELIENNELRIKQIKSFEQSIDSSTIKIDTATIRIGLFTEQFKTDLAYLKAALEAIKTVSQKKISITTYSNAAQVPAGLTWLFWLSERNIPTEKKALNTFAYQPGNTVNTNTSVIISKNSVSGFSEKNALYKRKVMIALTAKTETLWEDETGNPILTATVEDSTSHYQFYSRFNPEWNDLAWSAQFPEMLLSLMSEDQLKNDYAEKTWDRRIIPTQQILPVSVKSTVNSSAKATPKQTYLEKYFWLFLIVLFGLERWVSFIQKTKPANV